MAKGFDAEDDMAAYDAVNELMKPGGDPVREVAKIMPASFTLTRAEGLIEESGQAATVHNWAAANAILRRWSETAPKDGAYHKCDFVITFDDGVVYNGRYDLKHHTVERPDLHDHVITFLGCYSGRLKPAWMDDARWEAQKAHNAVYGFDKRCAALLDGYDLRYI